MSLEALQRAAASGATQYTAALGIEPLRRAIARYHADAFGADVDASRVIVTAGASAATGSVSVAPSSPWVAVSVGVSAMASASASATSSASGPGPKARTAMPCS